MNDISRREDDVRRLWSMRWADPAIAVYVGVNVRTVLRIRQRLGLAAWPMSEQMKNARRP